MSDSNEVLVRDFDDGVTLFTINRPQRRNAINANTAMALQSAYARFDKSPTQRVAVLTGAGDEAFTAGADVADLPELWRCVPTIGGLHAKPVVAAVAGWAVGGGLILSMMSDLLVAADNARFSYPEGRLGLTQGMVAGLAGRIPHKVAMEVMLLGRVLGAQRAHAVGLANEVVPVGLQVERALAIARELAAMAPLVHATLKRFVTGSVLRAGPTERLARTARDLELVARSEDCAEGLLAHRQKRAPLFSGR